MRSPGGYRLARVLVPAVLLALGLLALFLLEDEPLPVGTKLHCLTAAHDIEAFATVEEADLVGADFTKDSENFMCIAVDMKRMFIGRPAVRRITAGTRVNGSDFQP